MAETIKIADQFTRYPGGRYPEDGDGNGTQFRERFLVPILQNGQHATIVLDDVAGYPSSFLEEAFGGLVRVSGYSADQVLSTFSFEAETPGFSRYIEMINRYVKAAAAKLAPSRG